MTVAQSEKVNQEVLQQLRRELGPGEHILWLGAPDARASMRKRFDWMWLVFGVVWTIGSLAAFVSTIRDDPRIGFSALLFVAIGLLTISTPWWDYLRARRTVFAITNRRLVMAQGEGKTVLFGDDGLSLGISEPQTLSCGLERLDRITCRPGPNGVGDLTFTLLPSNYVSRWETRRRPELVGVPDVAAVKALLEDAIRQARVRRSAVDPQATQPNL